MEISHRFFPWSRRCSVFREGNDEREQTVNQLLTEMDGFEGNKARLCKGRPWAGEEP